MSIIQDLLRRAQSSPRDTYITKSDVWAMRLYFNNAKRKPRAPITEHAKQLVAAAPLQLSGEFEADSIKWLHGIVMTKNFDPRDTAETRALGQRALRIASASNIRIFWVGLWFDGGSRNTTYESRVSPGHEKFATYSVFRVMDDQKRYFDYVYLPWQARAYDDAESRAGMMLVKPEDFYGASL